MLRGLKTILLSTGLGAAAGYGYTTYQNQSLQEVTPPAKPLPPALNKSVPLPKNEPTKELKAALEQVKELAAKKPPAVTLPKKPVEVSRTRPEDIKPTRPEDIKPTLELVRILEQRQAELAKVITNPAPPTKLAAPKAAAPTTPPVEPENLQTGLEAKLEDLSSTVDATRSEIKEMQEQKEALMTQQFEEIYHRQLQELLPTVS